MISISKLKKALINIATTIACLLWFVLVVYIGIFLIDLVIRNLKFSTDFFKFQYNGDWFLMIFSILILLIGIILIRISSLNKDYHFYQFINRNLGLAMIASVVIFIVCEIILNCVMQKYTAKAVCNAVRWSNICYGISYFVIGCLLLSSLFINREWIKSNNWYIFGCSLGPVIFLQQIVQYNLSFLDFINNKNVTYSKLAMALKAVNHQGLHVDFTLMNDAYRPALIAMIFCLLITIVIGGCHFAIQIRKKQIQKEQEGKA